MAGEKILIADDDDAIRSLISQVVTQIGYITIMAADGEEALSSVRSEKPAVILLDIQMPKMSGNEVLRRLKADPRLAHIPVVVISGVNDTDTIVECLELGAEDYIIKPFKMPLLKARLDNALAKLHAYETEREYQQKLESANANLEKRVRAQVREITVAHRETLFALSKLADSRDPETGEHLERVREYARILAIQLSGNEAYAPFINAEFIENVYVTSPLHDIGKVGVPDRILLKPGKLTDDEFAIIKLHTTIGADTLRYVENRYPGNRFVRMGVEIAESHHERWDGKGYPNALSDGNIPIAARIVAVADVYDVITSKRCYKEAESHETSCERIEADSGTCFDPAVVRSFLEVENEFKSIRLKFTDSEKSILD